MAIFTDQTKTTSLYLCHHGIKGQRWGIRRYQNEDGTYTDAGRRHYDIKEAKANLKSAKKEFRAARRTPAVKGFVAGRDYQKKVEAREHKIQKAQNKVYDAQAALGKAKGGEKGELRAYTKMMRKTGLSGSSADAMYGGKATKLYDHIATKKGKDYAAKVEKKVKHQLIGTIAAGTAISVGSQVVSIYLDSKKGY